MNISQLNDIVPGCQIFRREKNQNQICQIDFSLILVINISLARIIALLNDSVLSV